MTNHSLRRTFCALLFEERNGSLCDGEMGHTDAKLALEVYAKVLNERKALNFQRRLDALLRGSDPAALETELTNSVENTSQE